MFLLEKSAAVVCARCLKKSSGRLSSLHHVSQIPRSRKLHFPAARRPSLRFEQSPRQRSVRAIAAPAALRPWLPLVNKAGGYQGPIVINQAQGEGFSSGATSNVAIRARCTRSGAEPRAHDARHVAGRRRVTVRPLYGSTQPATGSTHAPLPCPLFVRAAAQGRGRRAGYSSSRTVAAQVGGNCYERGNALYGDLTMEAMQAVETIFNAHPTCSMDPK